MNPITGMHWQVGLDEAGYGPNLGPLVQVAVAVHAPLDCDCIWRQLGGTVRKADQKNDGRIAIDDSKKIFKGAEGLAGLELGAFAAVQAAEQPGTIDHWLNRTEASDVRSEFWYDPADPLPLACSREQLDEARHRLEQACLENGSLRFLTPFARVTPTGLFNDLIDRHGTKAAPLTAGLTQLIQRAVTELPGNEPIRFFIDKQGGRNFYAPMIQESLTEGWVVAERESAAESTYRVEGAGRDIRFQFRPRADGDSLPVALASMHAKFLREALMRQFNRFWQSRVPELKPTAGYPVDAKRFYGQIQDAMHREGRAAREVWRRL